MPLFVALIPFIGGIILAETVVIPLWLTIAMSALLLGVAWLLRPHLSALIYVVAAIPFIGYSVAECHNTSTDTPREKEMEMVVHIESPPAERDGYRVAEGRITAWHYEGWHNSNDRVQLWIRNDSIGVNDEVRLYGKINGRMSRYDDYNELLHRRGMIGGIAISDYNTISISHRGESSLQNRAIARLDSYNGASEAKATMMAMVTGSRHEITPQLRAEYSKTGLSHLMAVSGLHLGIVLLIINTLLAPINLIHRGHRLRTPLVLIALWLYVAVSGASPSVIRAAIMLSAIQIAWASSSRYNSVNILSLTIIAMLTYNPNYLYDISFQLSVAAVMGILLWAVPIMRHIPTTGVIKRYILSSVIVGVVATLWTLPIISHTFGNIPIIGIIITPFAIICAYVILGFGIFTLLLPPPLGFPFAHVAEGAAYLQNRMVAHGAAWDFSSVDYSLNSGMMTLCYAIFIVITIVVWSYEQKKVITLQKNDTL